MSDIIENGAKKIRVDLTDIGMTMMIKALQNIAPIHFVSMKFGNGVPEGSARELTDLVNPLLECQLDDMDRGENYVLLTTSFSNADVDDDFMLSEIGVFATDENDEKQLFAYINQSEFLEPVFSNGASKLLENVISVYMIIDRTVQVTASIRSLIYATKDELDEHKNNKNNPHQVTKEQVGLGNVEDKVASDLNILFDKTKLDDNNLESGDKLSVMALKIFSAIKRAKAHFSDYENPHKTTAASIGAAEKAHGHSANDILSGTLAVGRGGTGKNKWEANKIAYPNAEASFAQLNFPSKPSFLMQNSTGAPYFKSADSISHFSAGTVAPTDKNILWIDTTPVTGGLKYHNGTAWVHVPVAYSED